MQFKISNTLPMHTLVSFPQKGSTMHVVE